MNDADEEINISTGTCAEKETPCIEINKRLREIRTLKRQNRIREQQSLVGSLKEKVRFLQRYS